ncbi:DNA invertase Pin [Skermanella stibiiresistens SB22]|uniref:DNA invertase Pin n=1 Tax=Skermanella stibiiresistens SB22 TaxID=1385369 RepID=W9GSZ1_9PROT|nr:recombinase family protein [Skermanella stibiiresistens]EWY36884.1 DNA invertase Pin [Skermanella stibiiresistens SB22]
MAKAKSNIAVGYVRVSTADQTDSGLSLEHQEARIRAYAAAQGLELLDIVSDAGVSAGKELSSRPGGVRVLAMLTTGPARHLIALKLDRVFRNAADALNQTAAWDKAGVGLHLVDMGGQSINTQSAMGRMFFTMAAGFAEMERGLIAERTAAAIQQKKKRGEVYGRPVLGFDAVGGRMVENAEEKALMQRVLEMRDAGVSMAKIADRFNAEGVPTKRGGVAWHASTVKRICDRML